MSLNSTVLLDRFAGVLLGVAIGDALGAPTEAKDPHEIRQRFGGPIDDFAEPWAPRPDGRHKGDARVTDDTLMTIALCRAYLARGARLEPHDLPGYLIPLLADEPTYVPEYGREMKLVERLFHPEKYLVLRLRLASADPREAGVGNAVNCGAAMYSAPVGLMHAGDALGAYYDAIALAGAHQTSYGREAAAIQAACVAEAVRPSATWESVVACALHLAKDGTRDAIQVVTDCARTLQQREHDSLDVVAALREAMLPYDTVKGHVQDYAAYSRYPSRVHAIEEVPLALGYLVQTRGDFRRAVLGAANYGRDCDSIAGMVGAMAGGLVGLTALPSGWVARIADANRLDLPELAERMLGLFDRIYADERARAEVREREFSAGSTSNGLDRIPSTGEDTVRA
ncbi:MAG TPA: ADP-ribosylglycohydrolase family protein [Chloroflexota bacterium]